MKEPGFGRRGWENPVPHPHKDRKTSWGGAFARVRPPRRARLCILLTARHIGANGSAAGTEPAPGLGNNE
jgi:hypothetical protein